jgi:hypothetical protein
MDTLHPVRIWESKHSEAKMNTNLLASRLGCSGAPQYRAQGAGRRHDLDQTGLCTIALQQGRQLESKQDLSDLA